MGSKHSLSYRVGGVYAAPAAVLVAVLVVLGGLAACATQNNTPGQRATKATAAVAGCPATGSTTTQDALARRACAAAGDLAQSAQPVRSVQTVYTAQAASVSVTVTLGGAVPLTDQQISAARELTKSLSLREQQAMWASGIALKEARVTVMGPTQDEYANIIAQPYGSVVLDAATAARFDWASLSADGAWDRYDSAYLRPTFDLVDDVPAAP